MPAFRSSRMPSPWWLLTIPAVIVIFKPRSAAAQAADAAEVQRIVKESREIIAGTRSTYSKPA